MDDKVGYSFVMMLSHYNKLIRERDEIVANLGLPIKRGGNVIGSLIADLQVITKKIDDFERKVVWTEDINR